MITIFFSWKKPSMLWYYLRVPKSEDLLRHFRAFKIWRERLQIRCLTVPPPTLPLPTALTSLPGAVHSSGGAEAEQDGCASGSGELRVEGGGRTRGSKSDGQATKKTREDQRSPSEWEDFCFREAQRAPARACPRRATAVSPSPAPTVHSQGVLSTIHRTD